MRTISVILVGLSAFAIFAQEHRHDENLTDQEAITGNTMIQKTSDPFGNEVFEITYPNIPFLPEAPYNDPDNPRFVPQVDEFENTVSNKMSTTVNVYVVADEEFRAAHPNWQNLTYQIIETADNAFYRDFGHNLLVVGYLSWTSKATSSSGLLAQLASDTVSLPNSICIGFSADSNFTAGSISYTYTSDPGVGVTMLGDIGTTASICTVRKNIGHAYGLSTDFGGPPCIMNPAYTCSVDYFDTAHAAQFSGNLSWF